MRLVRTAFVAVAAWLVSACSGGGGSTSAPAPVPAFTGIGSTAKIDQKITFSIIVPAPANGSAGTAKRRLSSGLALSAASPTPIPTTPYISPATGSVVLTLALINGSSPQVAPPIIPAIPVGCSGCTVSAPNIPAAIGVDRYFVQTYSAYAGGAASGNLISTGYVDVTVPTTANPAIGGAAAISIGGYIANILLSPTLVNFSLNVPGTQNILLSALDAGGATIVGQVQYVAPIVVTVDDTTDYTLDGLQTESFSGPLSKPIALHYNGGNNIFGTAVHATTQNTNGQPIAAATPLAVNVIAPTATPVPPGHTPTPPTPAPSPTLPPVRYSLYVADGGNDTVSEYAIASDLAAGTIPHPVPTPKRVVQFNPVPLMTTTYPNMTCGPSGFNTNVPITSYGTNGVALGLDGTIYTFPSCFDATTTNTFVFGFSASSVGSTVPTIVDPINETPFGGYGGQSMGLTTQPKTGALYASIYANATGIAGFPQPAAGKQPSILIGQTGYQEFGQPACNFGTGCFGAPYGNALAVDQNGFGYLPTYWNDQATEAAQNIASPGALLTLPVSSSSVVTTPHSAIAGLESLVGYPIAVATDGSTIYVLTGGGQGIVNQSSATAPTPFSVYPGVAACPPPNARGVNAPVNPPSLDSMGVTLNTKCYGGNSVNEATYIAGYPMSPALLGSGATNTDVNLLPTFVIGGDLVGGFGCQANPGGQFLAASAGLVYVINQSPTCVNFAPEIDVYNTVGLTGYHTNIPPVLRIPLTSGFPAALAVGPEGGVSGGQALQFLRRGQAFHSKIYRLQKRPAQRSAHFARPGITNQ